MTVLKVDRHYERWIQGFIQGHGGDMLRAATEAFEIASLALTDGQEEDARYWTDVHTYILALRGKAQVAE